ncbi:glutamate--tRNA ligase, partial [Candidatus Parcubacteria bacterium]|nr:glutamate--tRNA ligase [Candidatus Parcubacteria bacterium]
AKKQGGKIVLRLEDTDRERSEQKWVDNIIEELTWLGLGWDEGPFKQSDRPDLYKKYLQQLLDEKKAYYCTCSAEILEAKRQEQMGRGVAPKYDGTCRDKNNTVGVIRFKVAEKKITFKDLIRGDVELDMSLTGDIVIAKNLTEPLYNLAVVVDDFDMQISHVIRGEDHISNTPKQILLQEALGFDKLEYGHLPLLLNPDKSKMSKRAGDVAVMDYHNNGYLPEAIINFIALLGWNPGTEKEYFTLAELETEFSIEKVQKAGAVFNLQKLDFLNGYYIREKSNSELLELCMPYLKDFNTKQYSTDQLEKIVEAYKARMKKLSDITEFADFFFVEKLEYDKALLAWKGMADGEVRASLEQSAKILSNAKEWDKESLEKLLVSEAEKFNPKSKGNLLWPLRIALSGKEASASPFEILEILGKEKALQRIWDAIDKLR